MSTRIHGMVAGIAFLIVLGLGVGSRPASGLAAAAVAGVSIHGSVVDVSLAPLAGVVVTLERGTQTAARATTDAAGAFSFTDVAPGDYRVRAQRQGFPDFTRDLRVPAGATTLQLPIVLSRPEDKKASLQAAEPSASSRPTPAPSTIAAGSGVAGGSGGGGRGGGGVAGGVVGGVAQPQGSAGWSRDQLSRPYSSYPTYGETYTQIEPNRFQAAAEHPLSTFGADVDTASYSNIRRFLMIGQLPPSEAVRIEELVNYFHFDYAAPRDGRPIALTTEVGDCPWAPSHRLALIGARASAPAPREISGRNIVLLIDVSGSMAPPERLPLIKTALAMFVDTLRPDDTIAIVTYAGTSGIALEPTPARYRDAIQNAIARLSAGGSTNGGEGLIAAYRIARQAYIPGGVNRVILATDGDFNVGIVDGRDLRRLIERERDSGVFLSVLGVGTGNLKDATMEMLADRGNGNYAYIDSLQEARRVLIREGEATLETVAKDVKFQVEFNPAAVYAWKLLGYEDRALAARDFNNDRKDAGDMGAGHTVTALYEIVPIGAETDNDRRGADRPEVDPLKYQSSPEPRVVRPATSDARPGEWLTVKARYKAPEGDTSDLVTRVVRAGDRGRQLPLAAAVAEFGLLLRDAPRNIARWDTLSRRLDGLDVPAPVAADVSSFKELVAMAAGLAKLR